MKNDLLKLAIQSRENSYSPYSHKKVGAALLLKNGKAFGGTNIENVSFGGTVCAERVAIWKALSEFPGQRVTEIVVLTDQAEPWPPCGFCRQVVSEFADPQLIVHLANLQGIQKTLSFYKDLFPLGFSPDQF